MLVMHSPLHSSSCTLLRLVIFYPKLYKKTLMPKHKQKCAFIIQLFTAGEGMAHGSRNKSTTEDCQHKLTCTQPKNLQRN